MGGEIWIEIYNGVVVVAPADPHLLFCQLWLEPTLVIDAFKYSEQRVPILLISSYRYLVIKVMPMLTAPILAEFWGHQYNNNSKIYMRLMYAKVLLMYPFSSLLLMITHAAWYSRLRSFVTASLMRWMMGGVIHRGPDFCPCSTPT